MLARELQITLQETIVSSIPTILAVRQTSQQIPWCTRAKRDLSRKPRRRIEVRVQEEVVEGHGDGGRAVTACTFRDAEVQVAEEESPAHEDGIADIAHADVEFKPLA